MAGLDEIRQSLGELTKLSFVVRVLYVDPELITGNELPANHLVEKPVLQNDLPHVPGDLLGKTEDAARNDAKPVHLRDLLAKPLIHL